ncbi:MAG TPA: fibrobacter succinogenes major paralogous domain-containing protein [Tenuifilaceae bacterium]|nr:fibrobacter succinogenes major paralogous domain-containing protein [Tenuifilaceae bacterium]
MNLLLFTLLLFIVSLTSYSQNFEASNSNREPTKGNQNEGVFVDVRDNQMYKWVRIGEQVWMAENLNYETESGSWCYDNDSTMCKHYGRLYQWEAAIEGCPAGWHLPSKEEYKQLFKYVKSNRKRSKSKVAISLRSCRQKGSPYGSECNTNEHPYWKRHIFSRFGTDDYKFSALPGGARKFNGKFFRLRSVCYLWTSTEVWKNTAYHFYADYSVKKFWGKHLHRKYGISVRCVKDN